MIKPVKRVFETQKDGDELERVRTEAPPTSLSQPEAYENHVVMKPWGYEYLLFENKHVAIWFLHIKKDQSTSMHCHPKKKTSLTILSGKALCNTFNRPNFLNCGETVIIYPSVFHSTTALNQDGICMIEVETPPDKVDLVRLRDRYGRENKGYEGTCDMVTENLGRYNYMHIPSHATSGAAYIPNRFTIQIEQFRQGIKEGERFSPQTGALYCVCKGSLFSRRHGTVLDTGETEKGQFLRRFGDLECADELVLMKMLVFG